MVSHLKNIVLLVGILMSTVGLGQNTFSIRNSSNLGKVCSNVFELTDGYVIAGFTIDTTSLYQYNKLSIERYSNNGSLLLHKEYGDVDHSWLVYEDAKLQLTDSTFLLAFNAWPNGIMSCGLVWFDWNCDTIQTKFIPSPNYEINGNYNWMAPHYLSHDNNSNIYLSAGITNAETDNDIGIFKLDSQGNLLWSYQYLQLTEYDICFSIAATDDGVIAMGANGNYPDTTNLVTEYFFKLSESGVLEWEYINRDEFNGTHPQEILLNQQQVIAVCAFKDGFEGYDGFIYSVDTGNSLLWSGTIGNVGFRSNLGGLSQTCDGGFVCSGSSRELLTEEDSLDGIANENILLAKFDSIGNLLWQRQYHYLEVPSDYHRMYDLKATSDGGYIMAGEATDQTAASTVWQPELPRQQAWILKVDACGCLVPGCDGERIAFDCGCDTVFFPVVENHFLIGPNPASTTLNIFYADAANNEDVEFQIHDMTGRLLLSFVPATTNTTCIADVSDWVIGSYFISIYEKNNLLQSEKFLVSR